jgi:hypothetical protein
VLLAQVLHTLAAHTQLVAVADGGMTLAQQLLKVVQQIQEMVAEVLLEIKRVLVLMVVLELLLFAIRNHRWLNGN